MSRFFGWVSLGVISNFLVFPEYLLVALLWFFLVGSVLLGVFWAGFVNQVKMVGLVLRC